MITDWLPEWARWMRNSHGEIRRICGYPSRSAGFVGSGSAVSEDSAEHLCDASDLYMIRVVDTCIRQLDGRHYAAICNEYLNDLWSYRGDPVVVLAEAIEMLELMAKRKGVE